MKRLIAGALILIMSFTLSACARRQTEEQEEQSYSVTVAVGSQKFTATLCGNDTGEELLKLLPLTLEMTELNGNEKYCYLGSSLPTDEVAVGKIEMGDIMLFGNSCLVLFYDSFSTPYSYTRLGRADDAEGFSAVLKNFGNSVPVKISLTQN